MAKFIITYIGGNPPSTPEEGQKHMAEYREWMSSLGDKLISPANPMKGTQTIHADGSVSEGSSVMMSGYSILEVDSMDEAMNAAKKCPFLGINGTLEVAELAQMPG